MTEEVATAEADSVVVPAEVLGAAVMLFNWIVINFVISGLHSYA